MLQRIQSLYLFIVVVSMAVLAAIPLANLLQGPETYKLTIWGIKTTGENPGFVVRTVYMGIVLLFSVVLPLVTIFLFRRRLLQIRFCVVEMVLLAGLQFYIILYLYRSYAAISASAAHKLVFSVADILPLVALVFTWLAYKAIIRDEALVRSVDRIR